MKKKIFIIEEHLDQENCDLDLYTHIRTYHACRPIQVEDYLKNGIRCIDKESALKDALLRIKSKYVSEEEIQNEFMKEWKDFHDMHKRVWLAVNKNVFFCGAGHYLIYGSEFINALAMKLGCRSSLQKSGIPTIFQCDIPLEDINIEQIRDLENMIAQGYTDDLSIAVQKVEAIDITDYCHPIDAIDDPYYYGIRYKADYHKLMGIDFSEERIKKFT